jgi:regulator of cell morphogenesis and NO signaling
MSYELNLPSPSEIHPEAILADLATRWAGASRVLQQHGLDFCCRGQQSLLAACAQKGLDPIVVVAELRASTELVPRDESWETRPTEALVTHVLDRYHAGHRAELPRLLQMARRVEAVHGEKADCPRGLADHLQYVAGELESHMQKEEQVLFPMLLAGASLSVRGPVMVMEAEHLEHGRNLERLRQLAHDFVPGEGACGTWRALYLGLAEFEREVMEHIHLENHVLFPRAASAGSHG